MKRRVAGLILVATVDIHRKNCDMSELSRPGPIHAAPVAADFANKTASATKDSDASERKDFITHVRTVHFGLVVTCVALWLAVLTSRESQLDRAIQQIKIVEDLVNLVDSSSIRKIVAASVPGKPNEYLKVNMRAQQSGTNITFNFYYQPLSVSDRLATLYSDRTNLTLKEFAQRWDAMAAEETLVYMSPSFYTNGFLASDSEAGRQVVWGDSSKGRPIFVQKLPESYNTSYSSSANLIEGRDLKFCGLLIELNDTGGPMLEGRMLNPLKPSPRLLTVLFVPRDIFITNLCIQAFITKSNTKLFGSLSGKGTFAHDFEDLAAVTKFTSELPVNRIREVLRAELARGGDKVEALGIKIPAEGVAVWGSLVIFAIIVYVNRHLNLLLRYQRMNFECPRSAWIGLYDDLVSQASVTTTMFLLPLCTLTALVRSEPSRSYLTGPVLVLSAIFATLAYRQLVEVWRQLRSQ
jgi:hypothetical protein